MTDNDLSTYRHIRGGSAGIFESLRGLIAVWGGEAIQFLDGLISNDMKTLNDGDEMLAAFPNVQGRLLAVVRVRRQGDRYLFETENTTREKVFNNLFKFTFAGDFFVEDLSDSYRFFEVFGRGLSADIDLPEGTVSYGSGRSSGKFVPAGSADEFRSRLLTGGATTISDELFEILRIENGVPKYGMDMDETTIVPELGLDEMISYKKGCYIGQEIIARIYFRGHVAKRLTGLTLSGGVRPEPGSVDSLGKTLELLTKDGKNAGRITSATYSPTLDSSIALAFVRYDYLENGTELTAGHAVGTVNRLPFVDRQ